MFIIENIYQNNHSHLQQAFELIESMLTEQQTLAKRALIVGFLIEVIRLSDTKVFEKISQYIQPQTKIIFDNLWEDWYYKYVEFED